MSPEPAEATADAMVGRRIGRYTVLRRLARGGMAELFLAEASDLPSVRRVVVIKRMLPELARVEGYAEMFLNEARILAALSHPNVVQVVEVGQDGSEPFIAMEHVDGESLAGIVAAQATNTPRQPLPLQHVIHLGAGILSGLHYLHERRDPAGRPLQLIHRDVSPRNVLCTYDGTVKLIDFGIARPSNRAGGTRHGSVKGTVPYMSPEQCRGLHLDRRTDLFSTGILLHELAVGRRLFGAQGGAEGEAEGETKGEFDVFKQIVEGEIPRPGQQRADCPPELEDVIMRALQKRPADRFQTAGEMLDALDQVGRKLGLHPSTRAMQAFMHERFADHIAAARAARASGIGGAGVGSSALTQITRSAAGVGDDQPAPARGSARRRALAAAAVVLALAGGVAGLAWRFALRRSPAPPDADTTAAGPQPALSRPPSPAPAPPPPPAPSPSLVPSPPRPPPAPSPSPPVSPGTAAETSPRRARPASRPSGGPAGSGGEDRGGTGGAGTGAGAHLGKLVIDSNPWCQTTVDGEPRGPTPIVLDLPGGPHRVDLRNDEFKIARSVVIVVEPDRTVKRRFDFPPVPAAPPAE